ncbi:hypothetical protein [Methyloligella solikamskensis]|uniref:Uncharacterized protein n=1 Tax=Methyloligella solikamskensis TaxID=1177756 RepID=A0ABW3J5X0_9HYPH
MAGLRNSIIAGIVILGAAALLFVWWGRGDDSLFSSIPEASENLAAAGPPQLNCVFYKFVASRPHLEFVFNVEDEVGRPRFEQLYVSLFNGRERTVDVKEPPYPVWQFDPSTEPKRLYADIEVNDTSLSGKHSEPIVIELYKYNPGASGPGWKEASLKSVHYQNLPGQCRQSVATASSSD